MPRFRLHHAPKTRASSILWLLEELGADYELVPHRLSEGTHKRPEFLAINPLGKIPTLEDRGPAGDWAGVTLSESAAIAGYLADALPEAGLAPAVNTPARATYAMLMQYGPAILEPAMMDKAAPRASEMANPGAVGWPALDVAVARLELLLQTGPWLLGEKLSAADITIGGTLQWAVGWRLVKPSDRLRDYLAALMARPAKRRALELEKAA